MASFQSFAKAARTVYRQTYLEPGEIPPEKGFTQNVLFEDICEGDHIMVRYYQRIISERDGLALYLHSFLIGKVEVNDTIRLPGRKIHSREIEVYDFNKGESKSFHHKGEGEVYSYKVFATAMEVDNDTNPKQWSYTQNNFEKTFEKYSSLHLKRSPIKKITLD